MLDWLSRDGKLIFLAKGTRTFCYGFIAVVFTVYLSQLGLSAALIGLAVTLSLLSMAIATIIVSFAANRLGRKRSLLTLGILLLLSAVLLIVSVNPLAVVLAAILSNVGSGVTGSGPFISVEQAILPNCCDDRRRNSVFSLYNLIAFGSSSTGSLLAGLPKLFETSLGTLGSYQPLFIVYLIASFVEVAVYSRVSKAVESDGDSKPTASKSIRGSRSKPFIARLSLLFALDSFGGGFIVQSILSYWFYTRFAASLPELGVIFFAAQAVTALSFLAATAIARKIGLLNTMVFTHLPSNVLLITLAFAPTLPLAAILLVARHSLSQMDVPTRQSYIMAIVDERERTAAAGLTNVSRTLPQGLSPSLTGYLIQFAETGLPLVIGGALKIVYDLLLYFSFRKIRPPEETAF